MKKIALVGIFAAMFFAGCAQQTQTKNLDTFAQCLTDN
jgi:PBP1b-binding outer membrane lipoprotein LpoB